MASSTLLYVATDEGILTLKSENGRQWKVESQSLQDWAIPKIAVLPSRPNLVFAGTRGDGVWVSEDFGKSWKKPCYGKPGPGKVRCLTVDPHDPDTLYAGAEPIDLFISRDAGKSWTRLDSVWKVPWVASVDYPVSTVEPHIRDIAVDPKDAKKIYIALQVGFILKSADGGASWRLLNQGLDSDVHTIVIDPRDTNRLFIATGGHDCRKGSVSGRALYLSSDGGESWRPTAMDFSQEYSVPLTMHPKNPDVLYSALANGQPGQWRRPTGAESLMVRTRDGGKRWERLDGKLSEISRNFAEAIVIDQSQPDHLYAALRSGDLYASEDGGDNWAKTDVKLSSVSDMKCVRA